VKVLLVSSKYQPEYSGSGLRAHRTHLRLRDNYGVETDVICSGTESTKSAIYELDGLTVNRVLSAKLRRMHWSLGKGPLKRYTNAAVFRHEAGRVTAMLDNRDPDLVHVFGYSPATVAAIQWARTNGVPLMLELVNMVTSPYQSLPGSRGKASYDLNHQTVVVAISNELGEISEKAGVSGNIWVRPNPVDVSRFAPVEQDVRNDKKQELFGFDSSTHSVVYVAKFIERKNHTFLIDVLKQLPDNYKLVLAGPPQTDIHSIPGLTLKEIPTLMQKAKRLGVADRLVVRPEFVDFSEYVRAADVTCFPSEREGMGTPLLESLAAGIPVVANAGESTFRDHITNGQNGFLEPLEPKRWAEAIVKSTEIPETQRELFSAETAERFSTERIDESYFRLMSALVESKPGGRIQVSQILKG
jgi:glycosyltransferase involved in cell wall biosynthesis